MYADATCPTICSTTSTTTSGYKELADGNVKLGMTTVATAMAGQLVAFTPKKAGRAVQAGKSCATVESGKWVGPAKSAAGGEVVAVNDELVDKPTLANDDPYGAGWMVDPQAGGLGERQGDAHSGRAGRPEVRGEDGGRRFRRLRVRTGARHEAERRRSAETPWVRSSIAQPRRWRACGRTRFG